MTSEERPYKHRPSMPLFLGYTTAAARPIRPGKVPSNIKDEAKIMAHQQRLIAEAAGAAALVPTAGTIREWVLLDGGRRIVESGSAPASDMPPAVTLVRVLDRLFPDDEFHRRYLGRPAMPIAGDVADVFAVVGLDAHAGLQVACLETLAWNAAHDEDRRVDVPVGLYHGQHEVYDPYKILIDAEARRHVPLADLCRALHIGDDLDDELPRDPLASALLALELAVAARLFRPA